MKKPKYRWLAVAVIASCQTLTPAQQYAQKQLACEDGDAKSCLEVAVRADQERDFKRAQHYMRLACEVGALNCDIVGEYELTTKDEPAATRHWELGCLRGDSSCCHALGNLALKEHRVSSAERWFQVACEKGVKESCEKLEIPLEKQVRDVGATHLDEDGGQNWDRK